MDKYLECFFSTWLIVFVWMNQDCLTFIVLLYIVICAVKSYPQNAEQQNVFSLLTSRVNIKCQNMSNTLFVLHKSQNQAFSLTCLQRKVTCCHKRKHTFKSRGKKFVQNLICNTDFSVIMLCDCKMFCTTAQRVICHDILWFHKVLM